MSSKQDLIEMQEVIKQCLTLIKDLSNGWEGVVKSINKINSNKPSTYIATQKELKQSVDALNDSEVKLTKAMEKKEQVEKKLQATTQQILTSGYNLNKQKEKELATEAKLQAQLEKSQNTYNRVQQKVNETTQAYNNLAAKKALGIDLNDKEQRTLALLEARLNKYQGVLKGVDANIGKYQRNVGNYASGWNGLSNSINQITREMPAFAVSMNTGFLALSNNIPILFDEIKRVNDEVTALRKAGKPTESTLTRLASSFFSLQTLMSLGVTLLTLYGGKLIDWVASLFESEKAVDRLAESTKTLNEVKLQGAKDAQKEIIELNKYVAIAQNANNTTEARVKASNKLRDTYPEYFRNMSNDQIMTSDLTKIQKELTSALLARATAIASINKMTENATKILDAKEEIRLNNERIETVRKQADAEFKLLQQQTRSAKEGVFGSNANRKYKEWNDIAEQNRKKMQEIQSLEAQNIRLSKLAQDNTTASTKLETTQATAVTNTTKSVEDKNKALIDLAKQEQATAEASIKRQIEEAKLANDKDLAMALEQSLALTTYKAKEKIAELEAEDTERLLLKKKELYNEYVTEILKLNGVEIKADEKKNEEQEKALTKSLEERKKALVEFAKKLAKDREDAEKAEAERRKPLEDYIQQGAIGSLNNLGGGSLAQFFNGQFDEIWKGADTLGEKIAAITQATGEIAMAVMSQISEMQRANFEAQLSRLDVEKETALKYAGDSATGREEIERQYENKRKELQKKQAIAEKKMAIMQIAMNTAVGITSALAMLPPNIPLSIAIGAIGALQAGIVASTPIPEFWTGTDNSPEGLALTQERGAEMITDKNGKIKTLGNSKGAQLTYLNKGDKVYNASDTTDKINEMLLSSGISPIVKMENNGLTKAEMIDVMNQTLARQPRQTTKFDEKGVTLFIEKENSRTIKRGNNAKI